MGLQLAGKTQGKKKNFFKMRGGKKKKMRGGRKACFIGNEPTEREKLM